MASIVKYKREKFRSAGLFSGGLSEWFIGPPPFEVQEVRLFAHSLPWASSLYSIVFTSMDYIEDRPQICTSCYRIYGCREDKGWMLLSFLGKHQKRGEAEEALRRYLADPSNQSADPERYQIRLDVTSSLLATEITWKPTGLIELSRLL